MIIDKNVDKFKEECGVFGIFNTMCLDISSILYSALHSLQHRGQESCGIAVSNEHEIRCVKGMGLVSEVFVKKNLYSIKGKSAIGHTRYSTFGESSLKNAQPILDKDGHEEIAIAHNGNITNASVYKERLLNKGIQFITDTDSEVFLKTIKEEDKNIEESLIHGMKKMKGGYAILLLLKDKLIGARDPKGIRPLCIGKLGDSYILSSESCTIDILGGEFIRDVRPGEIIVVDKQGLKSIPPSESLKCKTCSFEYIYFAREDSIIDKVNVYKSRFLAGKVLYREYPVEADIVIGIPDSGVPAAIGYSKASGIEYEIGIVKNKYVGRTFINPSKEIRERNVFIKLNAIRSNVKGKRIVLVDDSIVRGNTSKKIVAMLRNAGVKEVHFRVASPIIKSACYLGINTKDKKELLGATRKIEEIKMALGVDSIGYISINGFRSALQGKKEVCLNCFYGD